MITTRTSLRRTAAAVALVAALAAGCSAEGDEIVSAGPATTAAPDEAEPTPRNDESEDEARPVEPEDRVTEEPEETDEEDDRKGADGDVSDVKIRAGEDYPEIVATVTNSSSKRSDYFITVVVESADGKTRLGEDFLSVGMLDPDQTTVRTTPVFDEYPADATVRVIEVDRTASSAPDKDGISHGYGDPSAAKDVSKPTQSADEYGFRDVSVTIKNSSSKRSDYSITIAVESADGKTRYTEAFVYQEALDPGQTATPTSSFSSDVPDDTKLRIIGVERSAT